MTLIRIENQVMREKLGMLFDAMANLGQTKNMQDKFEQEAQKMQHEFQDIKEEIRSLEITNISLL
jgi:hypothetical protein